MSAQGTACVIANAAVLKLNSKNSCAHKPFQPDVKSDHSSKKQAGPLYETILQLPQHCTSYAS